MIQHPIEPIYDKASKILILGSLHSGRLKKFSLVAKDEGDDDTEKFIDSLEKQ